jgi:hypothetical protein
VDVSAIRALILKMVIIVMFFSDIYLAAWKAN